MTNVGKGYFSKYSLRMQHVEIIYHPYMEDTHPRKFSILVKNTISRKHPASKILPNQVFMSINMSLFMLYIIKQSV